MTLALWCILVAGILPQLFGFYAKASREFDNENPRAYLATLEGAKARAVAAMNNGYEGFPLFAAAVLIAHMLHASQPSVDALALGYIASRIAHGFLYIAGKGTLRSLVWVGGLACIIMLFVISAQVQH